MAKSPILRPDALPELSRYAADEDNPWGEFALKLWMMTYPDEAVAEIRRLRQKVAELESLRDWKTWPSEIPKPKETNNVQD